MSAVSDSSTDNTTSLCSCVLRDLELPCRPCNFLLNSRATQVSLFPVIFHSCSDFHY